MATARRQCTKCGRNRAERFFVSARGRTCSTCRKRTRVAGTKDQRLQETYDVTHPEWLTILELQGNRCFICRGKRSGKGGVPLYDTDHDHKMEKAGIPIRETLRGLLCKRCNRRLLPACMDDVEILKRAIWYLENAHARTQTALQLMRDGYEYHGQGKWLAASHSDNEA